MIHTYNPVIFVDYDGNDYGVSVNHDSKTILIQAHFITNGNNSTAFNNKGTGAWNAQSGKNVFVTGSIRDLKQRIINGQDDKVYSIGIKVTSEVDDSPGS